MYIETFAWKMLIKDVLCLGRGGIIQTFKLSEMYFMVNAVILSELHNTALKTVPEISGPARLM